MGLEISETAAKRILKARNGSKGVPKRRVFDQAMAYIPLKRGLKKFDFLADVITPRKPFGIG